MSESDTDAGLIFKTFENATPPAAQPAPDASEDDPWAGWNAWVRRHLEIEREQMLRGIAEATMTLIHRERVVFERKLGVLEGEIREFKGMLGATLQLLGQKSGNSTTVLKPDSAVVELPRGFLRRTHDNAA